MLPLREEQRFPRSEDTEECRIMSFHDSGYLQRAMNLSWDSPTVLDAGEAQVDEAVGYPAQELYI